MDRLRQIVADSTDEIGVLALLQSALPKQGSKSPGAEPRYRKDNAMFSAAAQRAYHQRVISAWWVVGGRAWLVGSRLHCPLAWVDRITRPPNRKMAELLGEIQGESDRAGSALKVLSPLLDNTRWSKCPIILDGDFDNEWEIVRALNRLKRIFLINIRDDHGWPLNSDLVASSFPFNELAGSLRPKFVSRLPRKGVPLTSEPHSLFERWNIFEQVLINNPTLAELTSAGKLNHCNVYLKKNLEMFYTNMPEADASQIAQSLILARSERNKFTQSKLGRSYPLLWQGFKRHTALCAIAHWADGNSSEK